MREPRDGQVLGIVRDRAGKEHGQAIDRPRADRDPSELLLRGQRHTGEIDGGKAAMDALQGGADVMREHGKIRSFSEPGCGPDGES